MPPISSSSGGGEEGHVRGVVEERVADAALVHHHGAQAGLLRLDGAGQAGGSGFANAIEAFQAILVTDPQCSIAYWGIALSAWGNPFAVGLRSPAQLEQGLEAVGASREIARTTKREQAYLEAVAKLFADASTVDQRSRILAYESATGNLSAAYPEDMEATIFYALAVAAAADPNDKTYARQLKAGAILEGLFARYPDHPGLAHYIIHTYDVPALASRAIDAAQRYSKIAPSTPHALHMPSHTFTRVGDWRGSIDANLAAAAAARRAGQTAEELHASDYLVYAYLQTAQDDAAERLVESAAQIFARFDPASPNTGAANPAAAYFARAAIPARSCLERRAWPDAARLEPLASPFPYTDAITYFARGLAAAHLKDGAGARAAIDSLRLTMTVIRQEDFVASVAGALQYISYYHPVDYITSLAKAYEREESPAARMRLRRF
jgi:hypothetical protein